MDGSHDDCDPGEDAEDCLDEWGWDPMVDAFLEDLVQTAPRSNSSIDFEWVSDRFLEVLEPTESQLHAALERFSPAALEERWRYLRDDSDDRAPPEAAAAAGAAAPPESAGGARRGAEPEGLEGPGAAPGAAAAPVARDRVLEAMQHFLFGGAPRPERAAAAGGGAAGPPGGGGGGGAAGSAGAGAGAPGGGAALRRCLEELRWHGEALRRCAAGEDAAALCAAAAGRRRALLWGLGVPEGEDRGRP